MKKILFFFLTASFVHAGQAQITKPAAPTQFSENLNKVIGDFRNNFYTIQGDPLSSEGEMDVYRSRITLPGSLNTVIYRFHSKIDTTASWQAIMFDGETYENALKAYRNTSRLLNKCRVTLSGKTAAGFSGKYNEPEPNVTFANSTFKLMSADPAFDKFYAEIEMVNTGIDTWEVRLNLHNKRDDMEKN